tara:strand:- start:159 stop:650 length:492 start_codon:yes stop_codon:yes gene_type:complete
MSDFKIDDETRLNFDKMLKESGASDNTSKIRNLKHSDKIREQVTLMMEIKKKYPNLKRQTKDKMIESKCFWLWKNYMNIYNKLKKDELNLSILHNFLAVLKQIENGELDQHEGSIKVGKILKELYVDSAVQQEKKRESKDKRKSKKKKNGQNISWNDYKKMTQ